MTRLLKADFKKFFRDKLFLVVCILAVVFAVITPLLYLALMAFVGDDPMTQEMLSGLVSAKGQFFSSFSFLVDFNRIILYNISARMVKDLVFILE